MFKLYNKDPEMQEKAEMFSIYDMLKKDDENI